MKILVAQTAHLGDVVLTVPLLRALDTDGADGGAAVTLLTTVGGAELLRGQSWLDGLLVYGKRGGAGEGTWALLRALRVARFDVAVAAQRSFRTGLFVRASRAPLRVGFAGAPGAWAYNARVPLEPGRHAVERYLALAGPVLGAEAGVERSRIELDPAAVGRIEALLAERGVPAGAERACIAPGSRWGSKRWLPEGFAAVARDLTARGLAVVIVGSAAERELCREVARGAGDLPVVVAGDTSLRELGALLAGCRVVIGNDSGTGHLAAAVGAPVVTIFGPTAPAFGYVPRGVPHRVVEHETLDCRPCHPHGPERCPLGHFRCMRELSATQVIAAVDGLLADPAA